MPHPIYGVPDHALEVVQLRLSLPSRRNDHLTTAELHGMSSTKRGSLWSMTETWSWSEQQDGLQPVDAISHALLAIVQDRPVTDGGLRASLIGESTQQDHLPL
uniref:Uncharacterized protein n=1 Tax=uncultured prokaryote TaxID=198431 RepID=A0A0H5QPW3_9ZZZZ|nr:hypothetical protein [uncultured prokaryote]CRY97749.1 hypothetical protein [uncultured prokaryote]